MVLPDFFNFYFSFKISYYHVVDSSLDLFALLPQSPESGVTDVNYLPHYCIKF